jgi:hypothetical protein
LTSTTISAIFCSSWLERPYPWPRKRIRGYRNRRDVPDWLFVATADRTRAIAQALAWLKDR